jgi:hypothetical protein
MALVATAVVEGEELVTQDAGHTVDRRHPALTGPHVRRLEPLDGGAGEVWLVGTAHVSALSVEQVRGALEAVCPDVVVLELCASRRHILRKQEIPSEPPSLQTMLDMHARGQSATSIAMVYANASIACELGVQLGAEFVEAAEWARSHDARVSLGDRDLGVTLARTMAALSPWEKVKFALQMLSGSLVSDASSVREQLESMRADEDVLGSMMKECFQEYPSLEAPLVDERNLVLCGAVQRAARRCNRVVAVVGQAHLDGICAEWARGEVSAERVRAVSRPPPGTLPEAVRRRRRRVAAVAALGGTVAWARLLWRYPVPTACFSCVPPTVVVLAAVGPPERTRDRVALAAAAAAVLGAGTLAVARLRRS